MWVCGTPLPSYSLIEPNKGATRAEGPLPLVHFSKPTKGVKGGSCPTDYRDQPHQGRRKPGVLFPSLISQILSGGVQSPLNSKPRVLFPSRFFIHSRLGVGSVPLAINLCRSRRIARSRIFFLDQAHQGRRKPRVLFPS